MPIAVPVSMIDELLKAKVVPFHFGMKLVVSEEMVDEPSLPLKFVQSLDARNPLVEPFACVMESVFPENARGPETDAAVTAPVPLPVKRPPSVVEPVPPCPTPRVPVMKLKPTEVVATIFPVASVERSALVSVV